MKSFKEVRRYLDLMLVRRRTYTVSLIFGALFDNLAPPVLAWMIMRLLDAASAGDQTRFFNALYLMIPILAGIFVGNFLVWVNQMAMREIMHSLRLKMFDHIQNLPMKHFDAQHSGESIHQLNTSVEDYKRSLANSNWGFINCSMAGLTSMVTILLMDWRLGLIMIVVGFISVRVTVRLSQPLRAMGTEIQTASTGLSALLSDVVAGFREIKMYRASRTMIDRYRVLNAELGRHLVRAARRTGIVMTGTALFSFLINVVFVIVGIIFSMFGWVTLGTVVGIIGLQGRLSWVFTDFGHRWSSFVGSLATVDQLYKVLDVVPEPERYPMVPGNPGMSGAMVEFRDVSFAYREDEPVFEHLSFHLNKGESVALTGESGSGKSTVGKLLMGFYPVANGSIFIDGRSVGEYSLNELRSKISYVPQNAFLFDGTIHENICYGRLGASDDEIVEAARAANAHEFVTKLPDGYQTLVGERGSQLSGGQRQRIAIARAILKRAPILLLDEATSALDYESEQLVNEALGRLMHSTTCLVIAHRESTIVYADRVQTIA
jgi:ABC-type multidrug transport system fused ATPase/permease subunit